ncbi:MAG: hypothetical protein R3F11_04130 [Verrucomicrobiales bacterium]
MKYQMTFFDSNGPLQGKKRDLYEGGIRVPMIARWYGIIAGKSVRPHFRIPGCTTLAELIGAQTPGDLDGISMVPTLLGKGEQPKHPYLYWEFQEQGGKPPCSKGSGKRSGSIRRSIPADRSNSMLLEADIAEEHNLAAKHPEIAARLFQATGGCAPLGTKRRILNRAAADQRYCAKIVRGPDRWSENRW